jgi:hypothetical protein
MQLCAPAKNEISQARGRRLAKFRNCFCGAQAAKFMDGMFLCRRHWEADKARLRQDPDITEANIRECNARCEKQRYSRLKAAGICVTCGSSPAYDGCIRCEKCQAKRRDLQASYRGQSDTPIHPWRASI